MNIQALDPRNSFPEVKKYSLTERVKDLNSKRVLLIQCMPPYDMTSEMEAARAEILNQSQDCQVEIFFRQDFMIDDPNERKSIPEKADAVVLFVGPTATSVYVHWKYAIALEQVGIPVSLVVPKALDASIKHEERVRGTRLKWLLFYGYGAPTDKLSQMAVEVTASLTAQLSKDETESGMFTPTQTQKYVCEGSLEHIQQEFLAMNLTDGLPVIIPTDDNVAAMLAGTSRGKDEVVCETLRPEALSTSVEKVAINSVMAGAAAEHLPVILAIVSLYGGIQLESMTRSLNGFAFSHLVNGPMASQLNIAGGVNALGNCNHANAVIERAVQLVLKNCGHQHFAVNSDPVMGNPIGVNVFAENEAESPWPPMHSSIGYKANENVVSMYVGGHAYIGNYNFGGLLEAARDMKTFANKQGVLLLLSAKRAQEWSDQGLSRQDVIEKLLEGSSAPMGDIRADGFFMLMKVMIERGGDNPPWPKDYLTRPDEDIVPMFARRGVHVAVVGSALASIMQLWSSSWLASACIDEWI